MNKKLLKVCCLIVIVAMLAAVTAACGGDAQGAADPNQPDFIYQAEYYEMPEGIQYMSFMSYVNDTIYFAASGVVGQREPVEGEPQPGDAEYYEGYYDIWGNSLNKMKVDGTGYTKLENYQPLAAPDGSGNLYMSSMAVDTAGNIWVVENTSMGHADESGNWVDDGSVNYLRKLDDTGAELLKVDLAPISQGVDYFYVNYMNADKDGNIYLMDSNSTLWVLDGNGQQLFSIPSDSQSWYNALVRLADGRIATVGYETDKMVLKPVDSAAKSWGQGAPITMNANTFYNGGGEYDIYYQSNSNFYGFDLETGSETKLVNWIDSDIDNNMLGGIIPLDDGRIVCMLYDYSTPEGRTQLAVLTKKDRSEVPDKTVLTMATLWMNYELRSAVIQFNKTNPDYRIQVLDYSEFNTANDYEAGLTKLNTEIISGKVPDILDVSSLPVRQYEAKGLLEDLYPYIDGDGELSRDDLVSSVMDALSVDGKLYEVASRFYIYTVIGATPVVGEEMGWTMDELNAVLAAHPGSRAFANMDRNSLLYYMSMLSLSDYVNWHTGECNFDSDGFVKLLEFANSFPDAIDWNREEFVDDYTLIMEGQVLLYPTSLYDFQEYQMYKAMFGGEITYKGFPAEQGCGSVFGIDSGLAMSSKSQHKDGAWQFIRTLLTEEYQGKSGSWAFPTNKNCLDDMIEKAMEEETTTDENGNAIPIARGTWGWGPGLEVEIKAATQEEIDQIMALIDAIDSTMNYDTSLMEIVQDEVASYFAGQKSAQETASNIQNRVSIYVNEQL